MCFLGYMGDYCVKKCGVVVVKIDGDKNLMFVKGLVFGGCNGYVEIYCFYKSIYIEFFQFEVLVEVEGFEEFVE